MPGHFGIEADLRAFSEDERGQLREAITLHRELRSWHHCGRTLRLSDHGSATIAYLVISERGDEALVSVAQIETPDHALPSPLRLRGLDDHARYRVALLAPKGRVQGSNMKHAPTLTRGETVVASGLALRVAGLPLPPLRAGEIALYGLTREDDAA